MKKELPKKYDFQEREKYWQKYWENNGIYRFDENSEKQVFSVDTPPPTVSASHLHTGHVMSYSQADFVVRYKRMKGLNVFYPMGFDDNGVPTERHTEKVHNIQASQHDPKKFVNLCLEETKKCAIEYRKLWETVGISVDWSKTYSTIDSFFQKISQRSFLDLYKKGVAYRKEEPFYWSTVPQTALSQNDLEDQEMDSFLNDIAFEIGGDEYIISTTRPELLGACVALFANPKDKRYSKLKGEEASVPLYNHNVPIMFDESVDIEFGSGLMMVCTWGDKEDVIKWKKYDLPIRQIIGIDGKLTDLAKPYEGMSIKDARDKIIQDLKSKGLLKAQHKIKHTVKVDDRYGNPIEIIHTKQWFINVVDIKDDLLQMASTIEWYPKWTQKRNELWIKGLEWDWCVSRQRYHGVPIPIWYHKDTLEPIVPNEEELPVDPRSGEIPKSILDKYSKEDLIPDTDVLDTWATSGCTPFAISELVEDQEMQKKIFPNSLHPQAIDNVTVWAFYCMVMGHYHFGSIPFKEVMTSGHGVDEKGGKISKRLGNFIDPHEIVANYSADALRYWATGSTLGKNHKFDIDEIKKGKHTVNKLWNAMKFASMNLKGYEYKEIEWELLEIEDKWILSELYKAHIQISKFFEKYEYAKARTILDDLFWGSFCNYYLEMIKHRSDDSSAKWTLFTVALSVLKMYAPIMPFVTEEIYSILFKDYEGIESIHRTDWDKNIQKWKLDESETKSADDYLNEVRNIRKTRTDMNIRWKELMDYEFKFVTDSQTQSKLKGMCNLK